MKIPFYTFTVRGAGSFPTDMLRYDQCWPRTTEDSEKLGTGPRRSVTLCSYKKPKTTRWDTFGWFCGTTRES
jgi:hypothetical protein